MKPKTKKVLIIIGVVLVILVALGFAAYRIAMNAIGDKAMNVIIKSQINNMLDSGEITLEELEAISSGAATSENDSGTENTSPPSDSGKEEAPSPKPMKENESAPSSASEKNSDAGTSPSDAENKAAEEPVSPASQASEQKVDSQRREELVQQAANKIEESIPRQDKDAMMKLIRSRLSSEDIRYLAGLLRDGLTYEEISAAAKLANSRFTEEEIVQVKKYWHTYKYEIKRPTP